MPSQWPHGTFCWLEHATPNIDGAKAFYKDILELSTKELPMPGDQPGNYTMWLADGDKEIGGVHVLADDEQHKNVPPHWMPYIAVDGIDDVVARAKDLGARVTVEPFDIPNTGRMALLCDPTDANFALWSRDGNHAGGFKPEGAPSVGMPCWHELLTKDTDKAIAFYGELLGWSHSSRDIPYMPGAQYHMFSLGEQPVAGMMAIAEDWGTDAAQLGSLLRGRRHRQGGRSGQSQRWTGTDAGDGDGGRWPLCDVRRCNGRCLFRARARLEVATERLR
jgi:predicted enzyme related to lactoylglutathione lyase